MLCLIIVQMPLSNSSVRILLTLRQLRDSSVLRLVDSLSQLLVTVMPGHTTKEMGLFPVMALQEVGMANVARLDVIWEPITSHLSQVKGM